MKMKTQLITCGMLRKECLEKKLYHQYIRKEERYKTHRVNFHLRNLKKDEQLKPKVSREFFLIFHFCENV